MQSTAHKVISYKNLPPQLGIPGLLAVWLFLEHQGVAPWGFWVFYFLAALVVGVGIHGLFTAEPVDLFAPRADTEPEVKAIKDPFVVVGECIEIERTYVDELIVKVLDAGGKPIFAFDPRIVGLGEVLRIKDMHTELKVHYTH